MCSITDDNSLLTCIKTDIDPLFENIILKMILKLKCEHIVLKNLYHTDDQYVVTYILLNCRYLRYFDKNRFISSGSSIVL